MYFYLSRTLGELAVPSTFMMLLIIGGLLLAWSSRFVRSGRWITAAGVALLLIVDLTPLGTALLVPLENRFPQWDDRRGPPTGIIVLGGVVNPYISVMRNEISLDLAANRLIAAVELHRRYPGLRIIFSGGNSNLFFKGRTEAPFAARFLQNLGVPSSDIALDERSRNTFENAVYARKIAEPKPGEHWLLVTSAAHMPRAMGLFHAAGFAVEAYPVGYMTGGWRDVRALWSSSLATRFIRLDFAAHEWEGLIVDWITGRTATLFPGPADNGAP